MSKVRIAGFIVAAVAVAGAAAHSEPSRAEASLPALVLAAEVCDSYCEPCEGEGHYNGVVNSEGASNTGTLHSCSQNNTCQYHNLCTPPGGGFALQDVWDAVNEGNMKALAALTKEFPETVVVDERRNAVQVLDCFKEPVVHITLGERQMASLTE